MCSRTPTLRRCAALWMFRRRGPSAGRSGWLVSEPSPTFQEEVHLAAAAPGETLPGPGLAVAGDLETAVRALDAPAKLQQIPVRTFRCVPPLFCSGGFAGCFAGGAGGTRGTGGTVTLSRAASSSPVSFSLGLDRPSSEFLLLMFHPALSFPWSGSAPPSGRCAPSFR